ncbi:MAG: tetratricopeptide repeat protein [Flavobacteriales bacterium]|nr:tetratricopeptide repeat protein [Flavobacteriales bacterium]
MHFWMGKKRSNTAFPFLILLTGIIVLVVLSDQVANNINETPRRVEVKPLSALSVNDLVWQFELDETSNDVTFKEDSIYQKAVADYKARKWNLAELGFVSLNARYPLKAEILNYLGLIELNQSRPLEAQGFFKSALDAQPEYDAAMINLGLVSARLENFEVADSLYQMAMVLSPMNPKPFLNKGIMHCKTGEWRQAESVLQQAVEKSSGDKKAKALTYLGMAMLNQADTGKAQVHFNEAINLVPAYTFPRVHLAMSYSSPERKLEEMNKVIALNENHAPAHFYLGVIHDELGQNDEAEKHFERALNLNPGDQDIQMLLGNYYIENERLEEASQYFNQVYRGDTISPQHYFYEAKIASRQNDFSKALKLYDTAIKKSDGHYAEAHLNKGIILKKSGQVEKAISCYKSAIQVREDYEEAWYNLALAHRAAGQDEQAATCYKKSIEINPRAEKAMYNLALVLKSLGRDSEAVSWWRKTLVINPEYVKALYNIGLYEYKQKRYTEARDIFTSVVNKSPGYTKAWFNLGLTEKQLDNIEGGIAAYERAINLDPTYISAWKNLGNLHAKNGQLELAIQEFQQAIDLDRTDPALRYNLALQYEKTGQFNQAYIHLSKAVQLKPDYVKAIEKWSNIAEENGNDVQYLAANSALVELSEDPEQAYDLARSFHKADEYLKALTLYDQAIQWGKDGAWVTYWKGKALEETNQPQKANQVYEANLAQHPDHKFTLYRLYLLNQTTKPNRANQLLNRLKTKYPEFCEEKNL